MEAGSASSKLTVYAHNQPDFTDLSFLESEKKKNSSEFMLKVEMLEGKSKI